MKAEQKDIAVVGLGYVGLPLALLAAHKGCRVIGIDTSQEKIELLNTRKSPIVDESISTSLLEAPPESLRFTSDFSVVKEVSIIIICVPTPVYDNFLPNYEPVENACKGIAPYLQKGQLVVLESTVNPGVSEETVLPLLEQYSHVKVGSDIYLVHCPERINPGDKKWNVSNIPRVVGSFDSQGLEIAVNFYSSIIDAPIKPMGSLKEAEAVKIVENSFRDINIAFVNELAMSFSKLGIDVVNVIAGAATKPFAFMPHYPSCGVGGHCIPVDPYYLIEYANKNGFNHEFLRLARKINNHMPEFTVGQLMKALNEVHLAVKGTTVALLGLAYKANIEDCRESPALEIIKHLEHVGAKVVSYDPHVLKDSTAKSLEEALHGAQAVIVATAHNVFKQLNPEFFIERGIKVLVDGCNCLPKDIFTSSNLVYKGIGR